MNILSVVNLPDSIWQPVREQYPDVHIRTELDKNRLAEYTNWAEVVFGNCPADWALQCSQLRWLQSVSAGMDAYGALVGTSIRLTSARGVHHQAIAHHLVLMILALNRQLPNQLKEQTAGIWNRQPDAITSVVGQQVGIIGYGGIGQQLSPLARALGMRVVGIARSVTMETVRDGSELWPMNRLDELLRTSDHVVLCLPLTPETENFMNEDRLRRMKLGACLYNVARGELMDESALLRVLRDGHLTGAALDVFRQEPLPADHPLRQLPNVIITPHIAGHYRGLREATFRLFCDNLERYRRGELLKNEVTIMNLR